MTMLMSAVGGLDAISLSATWADIAIASPTAQSANSNVTMTWGAGGARNVRVTHALASGTIQYRINSGTYTDCPTGTSFSVTSGQTLNFRYSANGTNDSATITVADASRGSATVDQFDVSSTGF